MIQLIKMGKILNQHTKSDDKPLLMVVVDSDIYKRKIDNLDIYSNFILKNKEIINRFSILRTTTIHPYNYQVSDIELGTCINKFSSIEQTTHVIKEIIDNLIIVTDKDCLFIIDDKSLIREHKLNKIGI